jgi:hypothetical protein
MRGREGPTSRHARSATIMIAVAMREEAEVEAVVVTVLDARDMMPIFVRLGAALQADECEQGNSGRASQRDDVLAHGGFLGRGVESIRRH